MRVSVRPTRALRRGGDPRGLGHGHLLGPGVHRHAGPLDQCGPGAVQGPDGLGLQRVCAGLRGVRDPDGCLGRSPRHAVGAHADRRVVVELHDRHRGGRRALVAAGDSLSVRSRRGRGLAHRRPQFLALDPQSRTGHRAGDLLCRRPSGGRTHAAAGAVPAGLSDLADDLRPVRPGRLRSGPPVGTPGFATSRSSIRGSTPPNWRRSSPGVSPRRVTVWAGPIGGGCSDIATSWPSA